MVGAAACHLLVGRVIHLTHVSSPAYDGFVSRARDPFLCVRSRVASGYEFPWCFFSNIVDMPTSDLALLWQLRCVDAGVKLADGDVPVLAQLFADNQLSEIEQLRLAPDISEWIGFRLLSDAQASAFVGAMSTLRKSEIEKKRAGEASSAGAARKKPKASQGLPREELLCLQKKLEDGSCAADEWVEKARAGQIFGKSPATRASVRSGFRFWEAYVASIRPGIPSLPPRLDDLVAWTSLFRYPSFSFGGL